MTGKIEPFKPIIDKEVKMYTCGPSTYMRPHIGNYRTFLFEDVLQRYLEYLGYRVTRLMTLTDVEDKAIAEAKKEHVSVEELTARNENVLFRDFEFLKTKVPDYTVRASTAINQAAWMVKDLVDKGYAYWHTHEGVENVYFDPLKFAGFGKLAKLDMSQWPKQKRRFHKDTYPGTTWNRGDFILWHGCGESPVCWETEIGKGRPAWNIQDAAIVTEHLGFTVDVAAGGIDNLVRHHDYTLAVVEAVSGKQFARYWLHGAHLFVNGQKMSKSKGNVYYPDDLSAKGYGGYHVRFFIIYRHYRKRLNFTWDKLAATILKLDQFKSMIQDLKKAKSSAPREKAKLLVARIVQGFEKNMNCDLDVKSAFDELFAIVERLHRLKMVGGLSAEDANAALNALERVDRVLKVVF
ncbi:MAG TPA: class I tRNA ligase family protein [Candidatus Bathyarchaeia archaeon]|nr:class I tRNA ligase family protein [Candidatus Bathyarchaeia archaeon]